MEEDIRDLLIKTTCAGALGIAGAEVVRASFHRFLLERYLSGRQAIIGLYRGRIISIRC